MNSSTATAATDRHVTTALAALGITPPETLPTSPAPARTAALWALLHQHSGAQLAELGCGPDAIDLGDAFAALPEKGAPSPAEALIPLAWANHCLVRAQDPDSSTSITTPDGRDAHAAVAVAAAGAVSAVIAARGLAAIGASTDVTNKVIDGARDLLDHASYTLTHIGERTATASTQGAQQAATV